MEFHGLIEREAAERMLLEAGEGAYLVRASRRSQGANTLCMLFDGHVLNYKLYYDGMHYVGEKRFFITLSSVFSISGINVTFCSTAVLL